MRFLLFLFLLCLCTAEPVCASAVPNRTAETAAAAAGARPVDPAPAAVPTPEPKVGKRYRPEGETGKLFAAERRKTRQASAYQSWKRRLPFWPRKGMLLLELSLFISLGVFIGQILEVSGSMRLLAVLTLPLTALGRIRREAGPAYLMAFQSGAVANSMLVAQRDAGTLNNRELYTSVYIVSALSLFAHLPTFVVPIGVAFGWEATIALFAVRFLAIAVQIVVTLLLSRLLVERLFPALATTLQRPEAASVRQPRSRTAPFWQTVWMRSRKTLRRLLIYLVPTFACMAALEFSGFFKWLAEALPSLFSFSFLPAESVAIIPAQALSLYNGAIAAANFIDAGRISVHQAVIVILFGSMVTAPVRTLRHALPTYIAILGARPGMFMAVSAQAIRMFFLLLCTLALMYYWR